MKKTTPRNIIIKLLKSQIKRKCWIEKDIICMEEEKRMDAYFLSEIIRLKIMK